MRTAILADGATASADPALEILLAALPSIGPAPHVVGLTSGGGGPPLLSRSRDDGWMAGPYAGELRVDGERFQFEPVPGWDALAGWVEAATDLHLPRTGTHAPEPPGIDLAALLWARAVDGAARHGPPAFRRDIHHSGGDVRGHLDVRQTVRLRAKGASGAVSTYRSRELDNPVTRIIVAADRVLTRHLGAGRWRSDRVESILPQLYGAVGRRSRAPGEGELHRMRYTPITRPFKWAAELSLRIVRQDSVATRALPGRAQGLLLDIDDIQAGALLVWTRQARPELRAEIVGRGRIVMRDARSVRATLAARADVQQGGDRLVEVWSQAGGSQTIRLPAEADAAATAVHTAVAAI